MSKKSLQANLDQTLEVLRAHGFETTPSAVVADGVLVSKAGVAAVLAPGEPIRLAVDASLQMGGELARLLDRGYQKFFQNSQFEVPATAARLQAIHDFREELTLLTGIDSLFNESLGSTSDCYRYDRVKGREAASPTATRPWETIASH